MKSSKLLSFFLILLFTGTASAQLRLNISGDAEIRGRLNVSSGSNNMFIGEDAGLANTTGTFNTFIGQLAGKANLEGESNTFIGLFSGFSNKTGNRNTFVGTAAGLTNSSGASNTFIGMEAGRNNSMGFTNTFIGAGSGFSNSTGACNTFVGVRAGRDNSEGDNDTFIGCFAGPNNTLGEKNTFVGDFAGISNTTGSFNTFLGAESGFYNETGNNLVAVGYNATASLLESSPIEDAFVVGNDALVLQSHSGILGHIGTQNLGGYVNWGTASDGRMKKRVQEDIHGLDFILQLHPVSYQIDALQLDRFVRRGMDEARAGKEDLSAEEKSRISERNKIYKGYLREKSAIRYTGFIAQEVEKAMTATGFEFSGLVKPAHDQDHYSLRYAEFVVPLVKATQEQQELIEKQEKEQLAHQQKIEQLESEVTELKALVQQLLAHQQDQTPVPSYELTTKSPVRLSQNYPNPFHEGTLIDYTIPAEIQQARLEIHSMDGKLLETIPIRNTGTGRININAGSYPAGTYLYSLFLDGKVIDTKKMLLVPK